MNLTRRVHAKLQRDGLRATVATGLTAVRAALDFRHRAAYRKMLQEEQLQNRFSAIYADNLWNSAESLSGQGSEIAFTENLRGWLARSIPHYGIKRFVDAPCGDFNWMRLVLPQVEVDYVGLDIVESVIAANQQAHDGPRVRFAVANLCEDPLPACDLLLVRDCLFHLSYDDIARVLKNLARTDYRYLLTTTHTPRPVFANADIVSGDFRQIDLFKPPFSFGRSAVLDAVEDYPPGYTHTRQMVLLAKADVPTKL